MDVRSVLIVIMFENDAYIFFISLFVDNRIGGILCSYVIGDSYSTVERKRAVVEVGMAVFARKTLKLVDQAVMTIYC